MQGVGPASEGKPFRGWRSFRACVHGKKESGESVPIGYDDRLDTSAREGKVKKVKRRIEDELARRLRVIEADSRGRLVPTRAPGSATDSTIRSYAVFGPVSLPVDLGTTPATLDWLTFAPLPESVDAHRIDAGRIVSLLASPSLTFNSVVTIGAIAEAATPLVRIHSCCATGDIFGSLRCECGPQLQHSLEMIRDEGVGAVIYLANHEGRGIGLFAKAAAYALQDAGLDTYHANRALGLPEDDRSFAEAAFILNHVRGPGRAVRLITNNPEKAAALREGGVIVDDLIPIVVGVTALNTPYLEAKRAKGHRLAPLGTSREAADLSRAGACDPSTEAPPASDKG